MNRDRNGKTLIELVSVMGVISIVLGLLGQTFAVMMQSEGSARRGVVSTLNLDRLATEFRNDIHAAERAELIPEAQGLSITLPDLTVIEYRTSEDAIRRSVLLEGEPESQEVYRLDESHNQFEIAEGATDVVTLIHSTGARLDSTKETTNHRRHIVRIAAVLGRDHRFANEPNKAASPEETAP